MNDYEDFETKNSELESLLLSPKMAVSKDKIKEE